MKTIIIGLGGSIVAPEHIDTEFLKDFKVLIEEYLEKGLRFIIIVGGGSTARRYQQGIKGVLGDDNETLDWIGIKSTILNAELIKYCFGGRAYDEILTNPTVAPADHPLIIGAGYKPGWSTDYDAIMIAKVLGESQAISLSNISYIYDKDPKTNKDAKPQKEMLWSDLQKMVGDTWTPGINVPMDPESVKLAMKNNIDVILADGKNLENLRKILDSEDYAGTRVHN